MKFAIIGAQKITSQLIDALLKFGFEPQIIITITNHAAGSVTDYVSLAEQFKNKIKVIETNNISLKELSELEKSSLAECEFALVYGWPKLVPSEILDLPKVGVFGIHGGPYEAPRCRGRAVFNWALIFGEENFFMYLFKLTKESDDGPIYKQINFSIERDEDIASIYFKSCYFVRRLVIEFLDEASSGGFNLIDQSNENGTYLPGRKPIHGGIDWSQSADQIVRFIRAQTKPFPGAFSMICNVSVTIWRSGF